MLDRILKNIIKKISEDILNRMLENMPDKISEYCR